MDSEILATHDRAHANEAKTLQERDRLELRAALRTLLSRWGDAESAAMAAHDALEEEEQYHTAAMECIEDAKQELQRVEDIRQVLVSSELRDEMIE